jgi:nicotinamidase-related amidase
MLINSAKTALLTLDLQQGLFAMAPLAQVVLPQAAKAVEAARKKQFTILHVGLGFEPGYPEVSTVSPRFAMIKERGLFLKGSASAEPHPAIYGPGETIVYKQRFSAFSENSLQMILRAKGIEHLVLLGISTSGIVLSTLRRAVDLDFQCMVIKDACFDADPEVHRVLTEKVFAAQATVLSASEFAATLAGA